jgi:phospholipid/cholesterol/gamma-HCH transport system permease protein
MPAVVHARQVTDDTLVVQLAGNWQLQRGVPELTEIQPQLNDTSRIRQLTFEVLDMLAWDTGLLTFLLQLLDYCHQHQIVVDQSGLPEGVRRLLALATAVPEREGARRGATRLSWLAQVGTATLAPLVVLQPCLGLLGRRVWSLADFSLARPAIAASISSYSCRNAARWRWASPHGISGVAAHVGPDADDAAALCVC